MPAKYKYTPELLAEAAANSTSIAGVLRYLGVKWTGGSHAHISRRLKHFNIDTSHFRRVAPNKGQPSLRRLFPAQLLVVMPPGSPRRAATTLRRALRESGVPYRCSGCKIGGTWLGQPMTLHVDHINGNWLDNRIENLRFLCPNCHSQTENFAGKGINKWGRSPTGEAAALGAVQREFDSRRPHSEAKNAQDKARREIDLSKVSVSMTSEDADFLDDYVANDGARTRSGAIRKAIRLLRAASYEEFGKPTPPSSPPPSVSTGFRQWKDRSLDMPTRTVKVSVTVPAGVAAELRVRAGQGNVSAFVTHALSGQFRCERLVEQVEEEEKIPKPGTTTRHLRSLSEGPDAIPAPMD